jgi:DNA-binding transcriptional MerR regulator
MEKSLPAIPPKRYFTIGEVSELCGVKPYVLRYWEQEFSQLRPMKRRGNRRYYQHHEVLLIRRIRDLLYEQGFTISGARNRLSEAGTRDDPVVGEVELDRAAKVEAAQAVALAAAAAATRDALDEQAGDADHLDDIEQSASTDAGAPAERAVRDGAPASAGPMRQPSTAIGRVRQELLSIRQLLSD